MITWLIDNGASIVTLRDVTPQSAAELAHDALATVPAGISVWVRRMPDGGFIFQRMATAMMRDILAGMIWGERQVA